MHREQFFAKKEELWEDEIMKLNERWKNFMEQLLNVKNKKNSLMFIK